MFGVSFIKFINTASSIQYLLLAREKRMTGRANFNLHFLTIRAQFNLIATGTHSFYGKILWMDIFLHNLFLRHRPDHKAGDLE